MRTGNPSNGPPRGGRGCLTLFFAVFLLGSLGVGGIMGWGLLRDLATRGWPTVPGRVLSSELETEDGYAPAITFEYEADGKTYRADTPLRGGFTFKSGDGFEAANDLVQRFPAGREVRVYVNPSDPADAALTSGSAGRLLNLLFFLPFALIGGIGLWWLWGKPFREGATLRRRWDALPKRRQGALAGVGFSGLFFTMGSLFLAFTFAPALWNSWTSGDWNTVEAVVEQSRVRAESGDDGPTYAVDVLYRYEIGDQIYRSNRYDFVSMTSSGRKAKQRIVDQYPPGRRFTALVDPDDPTQAVISREIGHKIWWAMIPGTFVVIGGIGVVASLVSWFVPERSNASRPVAADSFRPHDPTTITLRPKRWTALSVAAFAALFWNLITWTLILIFTRAGGEGSESAPWFVLAFMGLFAVIGVALVLVALAAVVNLWRAKPTVTLDPAEPRMGSTLRIAWRFPVRQDRKKRLTITLQPPGDDSRRIAVADLKKHEQRAGEASVELPADLPPSGESAPWRLLLDGHDPMENDATRFEESLEVTVRPAR